MVKQIIAIIIISVATVMVIITVNNFKAEPLEYVMADAYDRQMIDFELEDADGNLSAISASSGKPILLNFWTSWCVYCKEEAQHINDLYSEYKNDIDIISINKTTNDDLIEAQQFISNYDVEFPVLFDYEGIVSSQYRVTAIPTNFFIRKDGSIKVITYQITKDNSKEIIKELISE